jgi:hypothetical protein
MCEFIKCDLVSTWSTNLDKNQLMTSIVTRIVCWLIDSLEGENVWTREDNTTQLVETTDKHRTQIAHKT